MDGDLGSLADLARLRDEFGAWLMVDDAHGTGVMGEGGIGTCGFLSIRADIQMGTLSKALASAGGFVCGSRTLIDYLLGAARSFVFTTALAPAAAASALAALEIIVRCPERVQSLGRVSRLLRTRLRELGFTIPDGETPIIPILIGAPDEAMRFAAKLDPAYQVAAIRPPTVPRGTSRLRITATALITESDIDVLAADFSRAAAR
jgi:7-keto-8-aminopelargonate synthetase-like enzyme